MGWAKGILMKKQVVQNLASIRADVLSYYGGGGGLSSPMHGQEATTVH